MLKVDYKNIMVPSPDFNYYIHDSQSDKYIYLKNLTEFETIQQYYISEEQYENYSIILKYDRDL